MCQYTHFIVMVCFSSLYDNQYSYILMTMIILVGDSPVFFFYTILVLIFVIQYCSYL